MHLRPLGTTGLSVSALSLGAASLGGIYGDVDEATAIATVHRAFELGVNAFDASPYYGATRAETVLGKALAGLPRDRVVVMTKCGRYGVDDFDFSPARIARSVDESLRRLRTDVLDVCQLHDVEFGELDRVLTEGLSTLRDLQRAGKVRFVGITGLPLRIFLRAHELGIRLDTVISYCHATLFDDTLLPMLPAFAKAGTGVLNASPTAMGLLSSRGPADWHPAGAAIRDCCRAVAEDCRRRGVELAELALQFACSQPGIASTISGAASPDEITRNVRALERKMDRALLTLVQSQLRPIRRATWRQGRVENN